MPKLIFACDFDSGTIASQGWEAGGTVVPILQRTYGRFGRGARVTTSATQSYYRSPLAGLTTMTVARVYLYLVALPGATPPSLYSASFSGSDVIVGYNATTGKFRIGPDVGPYQDSVTNCVAGRWYCIDTRVNEVANPWVIDWQIDGVNQGTHSPARAAQNATRGIAIGSYTTTTLDLVFEDCAVSGTGTDYPLGPTRDRVLVVRRAGRRRFLPASPASVR